MFRKKESATLEERISLLGSKIEYYKRMAEDYKKENFLGTEPACDYYWSIMDFVEGLECSLKIINVRGDVRGL